MFVVCGTGRALLSPAAALKSLIAHSLTAQVFLEVVLYLRSKCNVILLVAPCVTQWCSYLMICDKLYK